MACWTGHAADGEESRAAGNEAASTAALPGLLLPAHAGQRGLPKQGHGEPLRGGGLGRHGRDRPEDLLHRLPRLLRPEPRGDAASRHPDRARRLRQAALGAGHPPDLLAAGERPGPADGAGHDDPQARVPRALRVVGHERGAARAGAEPHPEVRRRDGDREPVRLVRGGMGDRQGAAHPLRRGLPRRLDLQPVLRGDRLSVPQPRLGVGAARPARRAGGRVRQRGDAWLARRALPGRVPADDRRPQRLGAGAARAGAPSAGPIPGVRCASATWAP